MGVPIKNTFKLLSFTALNILELKTGDSYLISVPTRSKTSAYSTP